MLLCGWIAAALGGAWRRVLAVLPQAQAWLGAQPLPGARLLLGTVGVPLLLVFVAAGLIGIALRVLGAPALALGVGVALPALATLHYACVAAERHRPGRIGLSLAVHLALLLGLIQAQPPLALVCWPAQVVWLLRRAIRA
jgi:hypothetical protein